MKRTQGKNLVGYVTVHVTGENPEFFFQACADAAIPVWELKKTAANHCRGKIYLHHVKQIKMMAERFNYEITITNKKGLIQYLHLLWTRKEILFSILLCSIILIILSNIVWKVDVTGVSTDVEKKINQQLSAYGLYEGAWIFSLKSLDVIQQDVLNTIPELMYIGIQKKGTTYHIDGVEKLIVKDEEQLKAQHLIASKNGIIQKIFVQKGQPVVQVNDFVRKGDLLVSGVVEDSKETVAAEGEVYANTWYEVTVTSSLINYHEKLLGEKVVKHHLKFGTKQIPIWGFQKIPYAATLVETEEKPVYLLKWKLPVQIITNNIYNKETVVNTRTVEEAKNIAIDHVKDDLLLKLGKDIQIVKYYVLHESEENGKVKMNLYISVLENIADSNPIH